MSSNGYKKRKRRKKYSDEDLIALLKKGHELYPPITYFKMKNLKDFPSADIYFKRFGSWNKAMEIADIPINPHKGFIPGSPYHRLLIENSIKARQARADATNNTKRTCLRQRFLVLHRDNFTCQYCGRTPKDGAKLVVDHVLPINNGGFANMDNLITSCLDCNLGKADIVLSNRPPRT